MPGFFPRHTLEFHLAEPKAFRKFSYSLVEMAVVTGVLMRLFRMLALTHGTNSWLYLGSMLIIGILFLLGMVTAHVANCPLSHYLWRAPAFAVIEVITEMAVSALLIALGREPIGTAAAHWHDWLGLGLNALASRTLGIVIWCAILAGVVQLVRRTIVKDDEADGEDNGNGGGGKEPPR
jgi:hypothetical protein